MMVTSEDANALARELEQRRRMDKIVKNHVLDLHVYDKPFLRRTAVANSSHNARFLMSSPFTDLLADNAPSNIASPSVVREHLMPKGRRDLNFRKTEVKPLVAIPDEWIVFHGRMSEPQADTAMPPPARRSIRLADTDDSSPRAENTTAEPPMPASPTLQTEQARHVNAKRAKPVPILPPPRPILGRKRIPKVAPVFAPTVPALVESASSPSPEPDQKPESPICTNKYQSASSIKQSPSVMDRKETPIPAPQPWKHIFPQKAQSPAAPTPSLSPATPKRKAVY